MYIVFFHLSGIALLEILFYFLYVGNMETNLFSDTINKMLKSEDKNIENYRIKNPVNESQYIDMINDLSQNSSQIINYYYSKSKESENKRKHHNDKLFHKAIIVWVFIFGVSILVLILEIYYNKYNKKQMEKTDSVSNIALEMVQTSISTYESPRARNNDEIIDTNQNEIKRKIIYTSIHSILLAGLILGFEFWFFNQIIMNYQVMSKEELEYLFIDNYI
jgi:hypothetical protein